MISITTAIIFYFLSILSASNILAENKSNQIIIKINEYPKNLPIPIEQNKNYLSITTLWNLENKIETEEIAPYYYLERILVNSHGNSLALEECESDLYFTNSARELPNNWIEFRDINNDQIKDIIVMSSDGNAQHTYCIYKSIISSNKISWRLSSDFLL